MKLFELTIDDINIDEIFAISLVENPAIESNFVYFENEKLQFAKVDTEKRIVAGPILIPNKKILRIDGQGQPYEVFFSEATVEKLAQNYLKKGYQGSATIEHKEKVEGVSLVESWVKTSKLDKSNSYGLNLPQGTWVGLFKVDNDKIWDDYVKDGIVKGFSVEGIFTHDLVKASIQNKDYTKKQATQLLNQIREIIKQEAVSPSVVSSYPGESDSPEYDYPAFISPETLEGLNENILFPTKEMAEMYAELIGLKGSHPHKIDTGETYHMPGDLHPEI
tara:strand:- start:4778 stop:5608 length:831 start_codon:yes stop_codon:yes gene_type:complete